MGLLTGMSFLSVFEIFFWLLRLLQRNNSHGAHQTAVKKAIVPISDVDGVTAISITNIK